jgi:hypothetical protein
MSIKMSKKVFLTVILGIGIFCIINPYFIIRAESCNTDALRKIKFRQKGASVKNAQLCLIEAGYSISTGATGYYGIQTKKAVKKFYADLNIKSNGNYLGEKGIEKLKSKLTELRSKKQAQDLKQQTDINNLTSTFLNLLLQTINRQQQVQPVSTFTTTSILTNTTTQLESQDPFEILQKYISYLKDHDIEGINSVLFKPLPPCPSKKECDETFDLAYDTYRKFNKEDFINRWEDNKQLILSTHLIKDTSTNDSNVIIYKQNFIYFIKDDLGNLKILLILPKTFPYPKFYINLSNLKEQDILNELQQMTLDSDQDGLTDEEELCVGVFSLDSECAKTNPFKRDTDGNGFWDGIDYYLKTL